MIQRRTALVLLAAALLVSGCADPTGIRSENVRIERTGEGLMVRNAGDEPVYYFAVDRTRAALINWGPCTDPALCPSVEAAGERLISAEEIYGWDASGEVLFYWWRLLPTVYGKHELDRVRSVIVPVR